MLLTTKQAQTFGVRLAACFPGSHITMLTAAEWGNEFMGLDEVAAEAVLERIKAQYDRPPTIRQIQRAVFTEKNAATRAQASAKALSWEATATKDEPTTFAEWARTDPARARKLVAALDGKSYVKAEIDKVIARGSEIFDALKDRDATVEDEYSWSRINPPCILCGQMVANGPNAASSYDKVTDTWTNAHLTCVDARAQELNGR